MSLSPPLRRLSSAGSSSKESLINAYEAEEERIINILSRKLEQLREEKIELENALEAESEAHVNRLSRELSALRLAQQQQQVNGSGSISPVDIRGASSPAAPTTESMLDALRRENEQLRGRLVETERDYIRISRLNEIYREELIENRRRLGIPVDNLIGLASHDPYSQPTHRRAQSTSSSVSTSPYLSPSHPQAVSHSARVPIPRPPSQIRRPHPNITSTSTTPPSSSSASASLPSPFPFSPPSGGMGTSNTTGFTTPPSSGSLAAMGPATLTNPHELTYPSVPPPSLSSSFGEPLVIAGDQSNGVVDHAPLPPPVPIPRAHPRVTTNSIDRDISLSPTDGFSNGSYSRGSSTSASLSPRRSFHIPRRGSFERSASRYGPGGGFGGGFGGFGGGSNGVFASESPAGSSTWMIDEEGRSMGFGGRVDRGARVAETGRLVPRSRAESVIEEPSTGGSGVGDGGTQGENEGARTEGVVVNGERRVNGQDPT